MVRLKSTATRTKQTIGLRFNRNIFGGSRFRSFPARSAGSLPAFLTSGLPSGLAFRFGFTSFLAGRMENHGTAKIFNRNMVRLKSTATQAKQTNALRFKRNTFEGSRF